MRLQQQLVQYRIDTSWLVAQEVETVRAELNSEIKELTDEMRRVKKSRDLDKANIDARLESMEGVLTAALSSQRLPFG